MTATQTRDAQPDYTAIKEKQQQAWAAGDYTAIGAGILLMSELLCEAVGLRAGQRVLDVATGSGNAALGAARRFGEVTGIDFVPSLLERARQRTVAEGLAATFEVGDAEHLPYPEASFDVVLSAVGAMFCPDQEQTGRELARVCRPGGKIGMVNWTPDGFVGQMFRTTTRFVPPSPGLKPPVRWGTSEGLRELLGEQVSDLQISQRSQPFRFFSPEHYVDHFRRNYGPSQRAFDALPPAQQEELAAEMMDLARGFNTADDGPVLIQSDYLEVVAVRR